MQQFYFDIDIDYDPQELLSFFRATEKKFVQYGKVSNRSLHTSYVLDTTNEVIKNIIDQIVIKEYIDNLKFFVALDKGCVDPHCDARKAALNIPIYTKGSYTVFYDALDEISPPIVNMGNKSVVSRAREFNSNTAKEVFRFNATNPIILNTQIPHGVINESDNKRLLLSISFKDPYDNYEKLKQLHLENKLISN